MVDSIKPLTIGFLCIISAILLSSSMNFKLFNNMSANQVFDSVFRSMRKGVVPPFKKLENMNVNFLGKNYAGTLTFPSEKIASAASVILLKNKLLNVPAGKEVSIQGDLGYTLEYFMRDIWQMYYNRSEVLEARYSMPPKSSMYIISLILNSISDDLEAKNMFSQKTMVDEIINKALIPSYNMYGTAPLRIVPDMTIITAGTAYIIFFSTLWGFGLIQILRTLDQEGFYNRLRHDFARHGQKKSTKKSVKKISDPNKSTTKKSSEQTATRTIESKDKKTTKTRNVKSSKK